MKPWKTQEKVANDFFHIYPELISSKNGTVFLKKMYSSEAGGGCNATKTDLLKTNKSEIGAKADKKFGKPSFLSKFKALFSFRRSASPLRSKMSGRPMKYPYTYTAKLVQFPWKYYYNNNWMFKYYAFAIVVSLPIFYKIGKLSRSPENVKTWEEIRKKEFSSGPHH